MEAVQSPLITEPITFTLQEEEQKMEVFRRLGLSKLPPSHKNATSYQRFSLSLSDKKATKNRRAEIAERLKICEENARNQDSLARVQFPSIFGYYPLPAAPKAGEAKPSYFYEYDDGLDLFSLRARSQVIRSGFSENLQVSDVNLRLEKAGPCFDQIWGQQPSLKPFEDSKKALNDLIAELESNSIRPVVHSELQSDVITGGLISSIGDARVVEEETLSLFDAFYSKEEEKNLGVFEASSSKQSLSSLSELFRSSKQLKEGHRDGLVDESFPDSWQSILGFSISRNILERDAKENFSWTNPSGSEWKLLGKIENAEIYPGILGDSHFQAALASLSYSPKAIERLLLSGEPERAKGNFVSVAICIDGIWEEVPVGLNLPVSHSTGRLAFTASDPEALWVPYLEKAYAKAFGGYSNLAFGLPREVLRDLTGAPTQTTLISVEHREKLWKKMLDAKKEGYFVVGGSDELDYGGEAFIEKVGVVGRFAYVILGCFEVEEVDGDWTLFKPEAREGPKGKVERLVKVLNFGGSGRWGGAWGEAGPWTQELAALLGRENPEGSFFMTFNEFLRTFKDIQVCHYSEANCYSALRLSFEHSSAVRFVVAKPGTFDVSLIQRSKRRFAPQRGYAYSPCWLALVRVGAQGLEFLDGGVASDGETWLRAELDEGEYLVLVGARWVSFVRDLVISVYGPDKIDLREDVFVPRAEDFTRMFINHSARLPETQTRSFQAAGVPEIEFIFSDEHKGFGYLLVNNKHPTCQVSVTLDFLGSIGISLLPPFRGIRPRLSVAPGESQVVAFRAEIVPYAVQVRPIIALRSAGQDSNPRQLLASIGRRLKRVDSKTKKEVEIYLHLHSSGLFVMVDNKNEDLAFHEAVLFELKGCYLEWSYGSQIELTVLPGKKRFYSIAKTQDAESFSIDVKALSFSFSPI